MTHEMEVRVYYEDTDLAGIVYYANYLRFIERGRTEWVRSLGIDQGVLKRETGLVFAVRRIEADYRIPAVFDDILRVVTTPERVTGARIIVRQEVWRAEELIFDAIVTLAILTPEGRPGRLPADYRQRLA